MPNWTENTLEVYGEDAKILNDFIKKAQYKEDGSISPIQCQSFIPMPKELEGTEAPSDKPNWYDWQVDNWGIKWGLSQVEVKSKGDKYITYTFNTPWSPPDKFIGKVAKMYPKLTFDLGYLLEGYEGCGRYVWDNGKLIS